MFRDYITWGEYFAIMKFIFRNSGINEFGTCYNRGIMKKKILVAVGFISTFALGDVVSYEWDASNPVQALGDDVRIELASGQVKSLAFVGGRDRTVRLTGDPVVFAPGSEVVASRGVSEFVGGISSTGTLVFSERYQEMEWAIASGSLYSNSTTVVFQNADLSAWRVQSSNMNGNFGDAAAPYFESYGDGWLTVQMQAKSGLYTKVVKLRLTQEGADIAGEILWARYVTGDYLGEDFERISYTPYPVPTVGWDFVKDTRYYGCNRIVLARRDESPDDPVRIEVSGPFESEGVVTVDKGVTVAVSGDKSLPPTEKWLLNGRLEIIDRAELTLTGTLSGTGGELAILAASTEAPSPVRVDCTSIIPADWTVLAENASLSGLTAESISGKLGGQSLATGLADPLEATVCHFALAEDGQSASCQFQKIPPGSSLIKGCGLEFRQNGANVEIRTAYACFIRSGKEGEVDLTEAPAADYRSIATALDKAAWCVAELHCTLGGLSKDVKATLAEGFAFANPGVKLTVGGTEHATAELEMRSYAGFPADGSVDILSGGVVRVASSATFPDGTGAITVRGGGRLLQMGMNSSSYLGTFQNMRPIVVDGGRVSMGCAPCGTSTGNDPVDVGGSTYLDNLTLRNGGIVDGKAVRVGHQPSSVWKVEGNAPAAFAQSISLLARSGNDPLEMKFDVADVTGDADVDFTFGGDILLFKNSNYQNVTVVKTGAGTMRVNGVTNFDKNPTKIRRGLWMLGGTGTMNENQSLVLDGGGLACAAGTTNSVGSLTVSQSGRIVLGSGCEINFADSSSATWADNVQIAVEGDIAGSRIRFGTDAAGLTQGQRRAFRCNGKRMVLTEAGYLVPYEGGLVLVVK